MKCKTAEKWLSMSLDGELTPARQDRLNEHLATCERCRALKAQWERAGMLMRRQVPAAVTAEHMAVDVLRASRTQPSKRQVPLVPFVFRHPVWAGAVAAVLLLAVLAVPHAFRQAPALARMEQGATEVEWVETDLPGAMSMVYEDQDTGLTVIWVIPPEGRENGHAAS